MAYTFTEQGCVPPTSTDSLTADGEGMHTYFPYDLVRGLNNLGTYVNNHWQYVQASPATTSDVYGRAKGSWSGAGREIFLMEVPAIVPLWAVRMVWTAGARCVAVSQSAVAVYLSRSPYTANKWPTAFTTAGLPVGGYRTRSVSVSITAGQYSLATDTTTGITPIDDTCTRLASLGASGSNTKRKGYVIVTATGGTDASVAVEDFSFWFLPS